MDYGVEIDMIEGTFLNQSICLRGIVTGYGENYPLIERYWVIHKWVP